VKTTHTTDQPTDIDSPPAANANTSRRSFLTAAASTAVAASAALGAKAAAAADASACDPPDAPKIPDDIAKSWASPVSHPDFGPDGITGAQLFANLCLNEGLAALFCAPGNYPIINNLAEVGVPCYGGRHEGNMCAAADGYARASGEVTACSGTEGPGFTAMIMNVAQAHFAHTPLLVLASNKSMADEDAQSSIQFMQQQPVTQSIRKWGKRIIMPTRIYEYGAEAFRTVRTGVPGLAHLDFPSDSANFVFKDKSDVVRMFAKERYRTETRPAPSAAEMAKAIDMLNKAQRPVLVAGQGVYWRQAWEVLLKTAEKSDICVVTSGPMRGHFPDGHRLDGGMASDALMSADLVVFVGQYQMPTIGEYTFPLNVPTIRVHPEQGDIGRNYPIDLGLVSDEAHFLEALYNGLPKKKRQQWVDEIAKARAKWDQQNLALYKTCLGYSQSTARIHPAVIGKEVHDFLYQGNIDPKQTLTGYGSNLMGAYAGRWLRAYRPLQENVTYYQFGAMGPDISMMIGCAAAVKDGKGPQAAYKGAPVLVVTGDAGMGFSLVELDTASKYRFPVISVVYNNDCWGMFPTAVKTPRARQMYMFQENIRYDKMAENLGVRGEYVHTAEDLRAALGRAYQSAEKENLSTLINCQGLKDYNDARMYPPGRSNCSEPSVGAQMH
jgi:thiamine pyrophosphate-dependent acetolactate synthase large subunit-like protein